MDTTINASDFEKIFSSAEENVILRKRVKELEDRLAVDDIEIEIERGRKVIYHGNDGGGNPARLPSGKI